MRPHRTLVPRIETRMFIGGREAVHLRLVLRAGVGDRLWVFDGRGMEARVRVAEVGEDHLELVLLGRPRLVDREAGVEVSLYMAVLKGDQLALVVRAATELGVTRIVPLITARNLPKHMGEEKLRRLSRIAVEASKQSGRTVVPTIGPLCPLEGVEAVEHGLLASPGATMGVLQTIDPAAAAVALAVGPEGGFDPAEEAYLTAQGFLPVSLGPRVLRAQTAALTLVALVTAGLVR